MSEKIKSDTSPTFVIPTPSVVVKNPLLSASVTGLTFDDFTNKPLLLPAAPPFTESLPTPLPTPTLTIPNSRILNREIKSLVTVGETSDIDSDTLSEINLNSSVDESPLEQNTDANANSILSQAASSFSALPSVASTVFSTFSKRIYPTYSDRENTLIDDSTDINSNLTSSSNLQISDIQRSQQKQQPTPEGDIRPLVQNYYSSTLPTERSPIADQSQQSINVLQTPPKLKNPPETSIGSNSTIAQNTYRLAARKKVYAPIPGFSNAPEKIAVPTVDTSAINAPITFNSAPENRDPIHSQSHTPSEERKGGLFSLTNLVPTTVLQNISGLVQTAAGSITQTVRSDSTQNSQIPLPPSAQQQQQQQQQEQQQQQHTSLGINCFDFNKTNDSNRFHSPTISSSSSNIQINNNASQIVPNPIGDNLQPSGEQYQQQKSIAKIPHNYFTSNSSQEIEKNIISTFAEQHPQDTTPTQYPTSLPQIKNQPSRGSFENAVHLKNIQVEEAKPTVSVTYLPPPTIDIADHVQNLTQVTENFNPFCRTQITSPQQTFQSNTDSVLPTVACPPPPVTKLPTSNEIPSSSSSVIRGGQINYRLQKGTRLYKNALSSAEIAPTYVSQPLGKSTLEQSPLIFNPYDVARIEQNPILKVPEILPEKVEIESIQKVEAQVNNNPSSNINHNQSEETKNLIESKDSLEITAPTIGSHASQSNVKSVNLLPVSQPTTENSPLENHYNGAQVIEAVFLDDHKNTKSDLTDITEKKENTSTPDGPSNVFKAPIDLKETNFPTTVNASLVPLPPKCPAIPSSGSTNPYRKGISAASTTKAIAKGTAETQPILANFFTPITEECHLQNIPQTQTKQTPSISNLNFFNTTSKSIENTSNYSESILDRKIAIATTSESFCSVTESSNRSKPAQVAQSVASTSVQFQTNSEDSKSEKNFKTLENTNICTVTNFFDNTSNFVKLEKESQQNFKNSQSFFDTFSDCNSTSGTLDCRISTATTTTTTVATTPETNQDFAPQIINFFKPTKESDSSAHNLNQEHLLNTSISDSEQSTLLKHSELSENISKTINSANEKKSTLELIDLLQCCEDPPEEILQAIKMADTDTASASTLNSYVPARIHWFYKRSVSSKIVWTPFSSYDSSLIETNFALADEAFNIVHVEGGRYDVNIEDRTKSPVYWEGSPIEVRRCSWFYKGSDSRYVPFEEHIAEFLEAEYKRTVVSGEWHKKINIATGEQVVFHGPTVIVHFQKQQSVDAWGGSSQTTTRPRVVKRDLDDFSIDRGEPQRVDHLLFVVHGIGAACDLKFRPVEEVVDDFRSIAQQLVSAHYKNSIDMGLVGRVEILPISWHSHLHSAEVGIDEKLKSITLESIPKLRNFTNDTLLDVLFYTSPTYCQKIMNTVAASMNSVFAKYCQRHPEFNGGVSVAGHSLGSLILFDLLCHQKPIKNCVGENLKNRDQSCEEFPSVSSDAVTTLSEQTSYTMGVAGAGQPSINYVQLTFEPQKFFALGSPIGVFVTIRGIDKLGLDFKLPTCSGFYNIFHPFDPVAYRIEALVNPDMRGIQPVLIPHHKGRKRMHLELKDTMARVGADLKQRFFDTFKSTLESVNFLSTSTSSSRETKENTAKELLEKEINKVLQMQMDLEHEQQINEHDEQQQKDPSLPVKSDRSDSVSDSDIVEIEFPLGNLNESKRIDYVLQEAPLEFFNEYLFALTSHVCYWESEDTILFVMKEIYSGLGINADSQLPPQSMTIERPSSRNRDSIPPTIAET